MMSFEQGRTLPKNYAAPAPEERLVFDGERGDYVPHVRKDRFVRSIPYAWVHRCSRLGGKTTQVALALWFLAGVKQSMNFKLTQEAVDLAGCSRSALDHGLRQMEQAGLIEVLRRRGVRPQITIHVSGRPTDRPTPAATVR